MLLSKWPGEMLEAAGSGSRVSKWRLKSEPVCQRSAARLDFSINVTLLTLRKKSYSIMRTDKVL
jgi:hypothetical protein